MQAPAFKATSEPYPAQIPTDTAAAARKLAGDGLRVTAVTGVVKAWGQNRMFGASIEGPAARTTLVFAQPGRLYRISLDRKTLSGVRGIFAAPDSPGGRQIFWVTGLWNGAAKTEGIGFENFQDQPVPTMLDPARGLSARGSDTAAAKAAIAKIVAGLGKPAASFRLTSRQAATLRGARYLLPTWTPPGFRLKSLTANRRDGDMTAEYTSGAKSIVVQMGSEGLGDLMLDEVTGPTKTTSFRSALLGAGAVESGTVKGRTEAIVNWIDMGAGNWPSALSFVFSGVSPSEAVRVVTSVAVVQVR